MFYDPGVILTLLITAFPWLGSTPLAYRDKVEQLTMWCRNNTRTQYRRHKKCCGRGCGQWHKVLHRVLKGPLHSAHCLSCRPQVFKTRTSSSCYGAAIDAANTKFKPRSRLPKRLCISVFFYNYLFQSKDFPSDGKEVTTEIKNEAKKIAGCVFLFQVWHWFIIESKIDYR